MTVGGPEIPEQITIKAEIFVIRPEDGGREVPFTNGYRPNHNFGGAENRFFYVGQIDVPNDEWVHPGETRELNVTFINAAGLDKLLSVGSKWRIQEGAHLVAIGKVLEVG